MKDKIIFIIFSIIGIGLIITGSNLFITTINLKKISTETTGTVVRIITHTNTDGTTYSPEINFRTERGEDISFSNNLLG